MTWLPYLLLLFCLAFIDQEALAWINLRVAQLELFLKSLPLRLKLEWEIYQIRHNKDKYLKMADEILKEYRTDETD